MNNEIKAHEQDHTQATFAKKIKKEDGLIDLTGDPYKNYLKFLAYREWPTSYFFTEKLDKKIRVIIKEASYENGQFVIEKVLPEGKKEMFFKEFIR
jgi:methionyl-tRNA formyltransferase